MKKSKVPFTIRVDERDLTAVKALAEIYGVTPSEFGATALALGVMFTETYRKEQEEKSKGKSDVKVQ